MANFTENDNVVIEKRLKDIQICINSMKTDLLILLNKMMEEKGVVLNFEQDTGLRRQINDWFLNRPSNMIGFLVECIENRR